MRLDRCLFLFSTLIMCVQNINPAKIALDHFEKDLQLMAKKTTNISIKDGSFIDKLSRRRKEKEQLDSAFSSLQKEVADLRAEVCQYEEILAELQGLSLDYDTACKKRVAAIEEISQLISDEQVILVKSKSSEAVMEPSA